MVLDLGKEEDNFGEADMPVAILSTTDEVLLLQMDGIMTQEQFRQAFGMVKDACAPAPGGAS